MVRIPVAIPSMPINGSNHSNNNNNNDDTNNQMMMMVIAIILIIVTNILAIKLLGSIDTITMHKK